MRWTSIIAIYALFWVMSAFLVLPFGVRTTHEAKAAGDDVDLVKGQADSAPVNFQPREVVKRASLLALVLFGAYYLNYVNGWITPEDLDFTGGPPSLSEIQAEIQSR